MPLIERAKGYHATAERELQNEDYQAGKQAQAQRLRARNYSRSGRAETTENKETKQKAVRTYKLPSLRTIRTDSKDRTHTQVWP